MAGIQRHNCIVTWCSPERYRSSGSPRTGKPELVALPRRRSRAQTWAIRACSAAVPRTAAAPSGDDEPVPIEPSYEELCLAAQRALLIALRDGAELPAVEAAVRSTGRKGFTPDVAALQLAVAAMDLAAVDRANPLEKADLVTRHLAEVEFRNQRALQERTAYAINAVAAIRGGLEPDIVTDMYWWRSRDIVEYAVLAAVAYVRGCAERRAQSVEAFADELLRLLA